MDRLAELFELLKKEYGIETPEQLYEAIRDLPKLDITPMCADVTKEKRRVS